ncbi:MAG: FecR domain-containing protein [Bacteroidota bacterium]
MSQHSDSTRPTDLQDTLGAFEPARQAQLEHLLDALDAAPDDLAAVPSDDDAWADLAARLDGPSARRPPAPASQPDRAPQPQARTRRRLAWASSAVLALLLAVGLGWWQQPVEVYAPAGERLLVDLPDGSVLHLNSDSRIAYQRGFRSLLGGPADLRQVTLTGEAFFEVQPGTRPFVVDTEHARVTVLGTQFNVRARADAASPETRVTLTEGRVRVTAQGAEADAVVLAAPNDAAVVRPAMGVTAAAGEAAHAQAWRTGGFVHVDTPVSAILADIERSFDLTIQADDPALLASVMSVLYLGEADAASILHDVCLAQGCQYRPSNRGFTVFMPTDTTQTP